MTVIVIDSTPDASVVKRVICKGSCGATLEYTPRDIKTSYDIDYTGSRDRYNCITCPNCNEEVGL